MSCQEVNFYLLPNTQSSTCLSYRNSHTDAHPAISVEGGAILPVRCVILSSYPCLVLQQILRLLLILCLESLPYHPFCHHRSKPSTSFIWTVTTSSQLILPAPASNTQATVILKRLPIPLCKSSHLHWDTQALCNLPRAPPHSLTPAFTALLKGHSRGPTGLSAIPSVEEVSPASWPCPSCVLSPSDITLFFGCPPSLFFP